MKHLFLFFLLSLLPAQAAFDVFIKFNPGGIGSSAVAGNSQDSTYKGSEGWSKLLDFEFGVKNTIDFSNGAQNAAATATFQKLLFSKSSSDGSASLFLASASGTPYESANIVVTRKGQTAGSSGPLIMEIELKLLYIESIKNSGKDGDDIVKEDITCQYGAHQITFYKTNTNGATTAAATTMWSQINNNATLEVE